MLKKSEQHLIGVDLGGTKIAVGLFSPQNRLSSRLIRPTNAHQGPESVVRSMQQAISDLMKEAGVNLSGIGGIGVAAAGAIDTRNGVVTLSPNLPGWRDIPLCQILQDKLNTPVYLTNDANAAAWGEYLYGAGKNCANQVYLTVSTGIGAGIIINGEVYEGVSGAAGEIGHMVIDVNGPPCNCGSNGCLEQLASGTALAREARLRIESGEGQRILEFAGGDPAKVDAKTVDLAARSGDRLARQLIRQTANYLGIGLGNIVNIFNPGLIVIGGGLSNLGEDLLGPAREVMQRRAYPVSAKAVNVVRASLGNDSGIIGAAAWVQQQISRGVK